MIERQASDPWIGTLLRLQADLIAAAQQWSRGTEIDSGIDDVLQQAVCISHRRYIERIPRYRQLADREGVGGDVDVNTIVNQLLLGAELFKSYQSSWIDESNFPEMTRWLETLFAHTIILDTGDVRGITDWQQRLQTAGVRLTYSSGTSGRMSFVPRDPLTWRAFCRNSRSYTNSSWLEKHAQLGSFDCLIAGPRGVGMGIMAAASGLAQLAARHHYLFDTELTADQVQQSQFDDPRPRSRETSLTNQAAPNQTAADHAEDCYERAISFVRRSIQEQRSLLVFGAPFQLRRLCEQVAVRCGRLLAPPDSMVVTGGGWKSFQGERISRRELDQFIEQVWGIEASHIVDAYGTSELNCTLMRCAFSHYHIPPLIQPVVLDEALTGTWGSEGCGLLSFLDPFAMSYPGFIITGDIGELRRGGCECGKKGWYIEGEIQRAPNQETRGCGGVMASIMA